MDCHVLKINSVQLISYLVAEFQENIFKVMAVAAGGRRANAKLSTGSAIRLGEQEDHYAILLAKFFVFRLANAVVLRTYFNPDEYWQGPEVAHRWVFGYGHLTWEWQPCVALRSAMHPAIYALPMWMYAKLLIFHSKFKILFVSVK